MMTLVRLFAMACLLNGVSALDAKRRQLDDDLCACECHEGDAGYDASLVTYGVFQYSEGDDDLFLCLPASSDLDESYANAYDPNSGRLGYCDDSCLETDDDDEEYDGDDMASSEMDDDASYDQDDLGSFEADDDDDEGEGEDDYNHDDDNADDDDASSSAEDYVQFFDHDDCECECDSSTTGNPSYRVIKSAPFDSAYEKVLCASEAAPVQKESLFAYACDFSCEEDEGRRKLRQA